MAHTPGPWLIDTRDGRLPLVREVKQPHGEASTYVSTVHSAAGHVCRVDFGYGKPDDKANARLIAAAPELLNALRAMLRAYDGPTVDAANAVSSHIAAARAVIAKAEAK